SIVLRVQHVKKFFGRGATGFRGMKSLVLTTTDPASVETRLAGYTRGRTQRSPPTLSRWRHDWQATLAGGLNALHRPCVGGGTIGRLHSRADSTLSTDPASVETRLAGYTRGRTQRSPPTLRRWRHDWQARVKCEISCSTDTSRQKGNRHGRRFSLQSSLPPTQGRWRGNWHGRRFSLQIGRPPTQGRWRGNWHGRRFSLQIGRPPTQGRWS